MFLLLMDQRQQRVDRLAQAAVIVERMAILWSIAGGARQAGVNFTGVFHGHGFPGAGGGSPAKPVNRRAAAPIDSAPAPAADGRVSVDQHVESGVQPEINLDADAIIQTVSVPA
ncbi:Uncharacterised protein [Escherichia coli]|uniref:Uncharacterized protein n=1 Tax=Escherichia coli TaxID=562 RepID=A0A377B7F5_ECOLX|nr:Uncharacterised protein [Escherichia coli]